MEDLKFVKADIVSLKQHPMYNEKWLQGVIESEPSILGLGDILLRNTEKPQPEGGRIDTILYDPKDDNRRYVVEIQLGKTDESHIIRTIEYWDNESKRYPNIKHCAVIIAEEITGRFFNVISLFNRHIPLIAIQVKALKIENMISLFFTKVMDEQKIALEEDNTPSEPTNEEYWLNNSSKESMDLVKQFKETFAKYLIEYALTYKKIYIGLVKSNIANNFMTFTPRKKVVIVRFKLDKTADIDDQLENSGLQWSYGNDYGMYKIWIREKDLTENKDILHLLVKNAYEDRL